MLVEYEARLVREYRHNALTEYCNPRGRTVKLFSAGSQVGYFSEEMHGASRGGHSIYAIWALPLLKRHPPSSKTPHPRSF
jgi:hypothetical protein